MALAALFLGVGCKSSKAPLKEASGMEVSPPQVNLDNDSLEYELVVMDPRYETFLVSQPYPKSFYSNEYYRSWNLQYCNEWNIRHSNPIKYGSFYEVRIDYDPFVDYGLDFNYRLYHYFQFIEKEYGIVMIRRRGK